MSARHVAEGLGVVFLWTVAVFGGVAVASSLGRAACGY